MDSARGIPITTDTAVVVTEAMFTEGMWVSLAVGLFYTFNAFFPIIAWYGWRKTDILAMENNFFYKMAWYTLYSLHWFIFTPMALIWPFTYIGSSTVVDFYNVAQRVIGTYVSAVVFGTVLIMWALSGIFYSETTVVIPRMIFQEMVLYFTLEGFAYYTSVFEFKKAHDWFYYANTVAVIDPVAGRGPQVVEEDLSMDGILNL